MCLRNIDFPLIQIGFNHMHLSCSRVQKHKSYRIFSQKLASSNKKIITVIIVVEIKNYHFMCQTTLQLKILSD